jgi:hypothetical protein
MNLSPEDAIPDTKSGVRLRPDPAFVGLITSTFKPGILTTFQQSARFNKGDRVHKPVFANGVRSNGLFTIYNRRYNPTGYFEYQLKDFYTLKLEGGSWTREKDLKPGS